MIRNHLIRALVIAAASLVVTGAAADSPKSEGKGQGNGMGNGQGQGQGQNHAAEPAKNAGAPGAAKADDKKDQPGAKADDKAKGKDEAKGKDDTAPGKSGADRESRKAKQHEDQKAKLTALLKGPPDEALRQELRRHAERAARLERIKALSTDGKDKDVTERVTKLMEKEDARHDKWMSKHAAGASPAATPPPAAADKKGGAQ